VAAQKSPSLFLRTTRLEEEEERASFSLVTVCSPKSDNTMNQNPNNIQKKKKNKRKKIIEMLGWRR
jgi:hypothetical protein